MTSGMAMAILVGILALALVAWFATVWLKERQRSNEESHDPARQHTDTDGRGSSGPVNPPGA
jgi:hypothetical protein